MYHVDGAKEPNEWARYWALEALVHRNPVDLPDICRPVATQDRADLPRMLAAAVLARSGEQAQQQLIRGVLNTPSSVADASSRKWAVLRALRFVYLPSAVGAVCSFVEKPSFGDESYDAIVALGNVPPNSQHAENAGLVLSGFITRYRKYQYWDAMRVRAIDSLGRLRIESTAPLLLEEMTDFNPSVARAAAVALEVVLGPSTTVMRIIELLVKRGDQELPRFARGLREMRDQKAIAEELAAAMASHCSATQDCAQRLLSEIGGASAFEKLRGLTKSTERYLSVLDKADDRLRELFEATVAEARTGFKIVIAMDVVLFFVGVVLIALSGYLAMQEAKPFSSWATWITGSAGVLATLYGRFVAQPRAQVQASVQYLSGLKAVFLGYLRQLRQTDLAYTRRVLEDKPLAADETKAFNDLVEQTMEKALGHLSERPSTPKP